MSDETQLATRVATSSEITLRDQMAFAKAASGASIIPEDYRGKPANVLIAVGFGQSMGLSPAESLYRINVIKGKPTMSAELIAAQVRKAGHKLRLEKDAQSMSVTCTIVRSDDPKFPIKVTRDKAWAHDMGLDSKDNYKKQPLTMLTWRAITACAREACPEALYGVAYTPDEMHDMDVPTETPVEPTVEEVPTTDASPASQTKTESADVVTEADVIEPQKATETPDEKPRLSEQMSAFMRSACAQYAEAKGIDANAAAHEIIAEFGDPSKLASKDIGAYMRQVGKLVEAAKHPEAEAK